MNRLPLKDNLKKFTATESCPVRNIISRFSGKWSMLVLCVLAVNDATRFSEIGKAIPDISPKVLTDTLKNLESDGLISRTLYAEIPPRVEYSLTPLGKSLMPLISQLIEWALTNFPAASK
ncbi:MAG: helix-turn-helix transcriptional regulator [Paramuribaculum sp.]|nr:helix-turn-helix transcriptional regulator [Paramuribaculum sp.]